MSFWNFMSQPSTDSLEPSWQRRLRRDIVTAAKPAAFERIQRSGEEYHGELTAGMSDAESKGMDVLSDYMSRGMSSDSDLFKAAENEIAQTLSGKYDPADSEYYKTFRTAVMRELRDANDRLAAQTSARDAYYGGGRIKQQGELQEGATNQLAQTLGQLSLQERQNRLGAVPVAQQLAAYRESEPIARVAAAQTYGALPRMLEQAELDAQYQEWLRQLNDLGISLDTVMNLGTYVPPMAIGPSVSSQVAEGVNSAANLISSIKGGGGTNPGTSAGGVQK